MLKHLVSSKEPFFQSIKEKEKENKEKKEHKRKSNKTRKQRKKGKKRKQEKKKKGKEIIIMITKWKDKKTFLENFILR